MDPKQSNFLFIKKKVLQDYSFTGNLTGINVGQLTFFFMANILLNFLFFIFSLLKLKKNSFM